MEKDTARPGLMLTRFVTVVAAAGALVALFRMTAPAVNQTTVALAFVVLVVITASRWRLTYSVFASIVCTLLYNFFFLPPVGKLTIADPQNWIALVVFLGTSVLVSHLADRERHQAEASEERRGEMEKLYEFSQRVLLEEDSGSLAKNTPSILASVFGFRAVLLYVEGGEILYSSRAADELMPAIDLKLASSLAEPGVHREGDFQLIPVMLGLRSLGMLAVSDSNFTRGLYEAIGSIVAIGLERVAVLERSSRLEAAREGERLRSALLDSVTHDLRTPLTAIRAAATTLVSEPELGDPERAELVTVVDEESARLDRIIGLAVEMAQLDAHAVQLELRLVEIGDLVDSTLDEMRSVLRNHRVETRIPQGLLPVQMDRALMSRALRHLLENAAKYSAAGSTIDIRARQDRWRIGISVKDQGPGISVAEQHLVFDKFYRGTQHLGRTGTGMGLAIVKAIMEIHGGSVEVLSAPGEGAEFTVWLDRRANQLPNAMSAAPAPQNSTD
jgi:two-component system, OmpR family, sensor histidine kinase KdpD